MYLEADSYEEGMKSLVEIERTVTEPLVPKVDTADLLRHFRNITERVHLIKLCSN